MMTIIWWSLSSKDYCHLIQVDGDAGAGSSADHAAQWEEEDLAEAGFSAAEAAASEASPLDPLTDPTVSISWCCYIVGSKLLVVYSKVPSKIVCKPWLITGPKHMLIAKEPIAGNRSSTLRLQTLLVWWRTAWHPLPFYSVPTQLIINRLQAENPKEHPMLIRARFSFSYIALTCTGNVLHRNKNNVNRSYHDSRVLIRIGTRGYWRGLEPQVWRCGDSKRRPGGRGENIVSVMCLSQNYRLNWKFRGREFLFPWGAITHYGDRKVKKEEAIFQDIL